MTAYAFDTSKLAVVYLRQSTPGQVRNNVVATEEQYKLATIPQQHGFAADRILVVDEDLGVSGHTISGRNGMLRVLALLDQGQVACVVVRDVGRLSRDEFTVDIGIIARQCYHAGAKIVTPDKVYDLANRSDRFMLGIQGLLAGEDRVNIVERLAHHRRAKQAKGVNINGAVPPGYEKVTDVPRASPEHGKLRITSDVEVRDRIALILQKGLELGGVLAVVRYLRNHGLKVPVIRGEELRSATGRGGVPVTVGAGRRVVQWAEPTRDRVTRILKNPTYAGAIVNGRRAQSVDRATGQKRWVARRAYEHCVVIRDAHPRYITWDQHHQLLAAIARNNQAKTFGDGKALLSGLGLLRCGVCGGVMVVQYNNPQRRSRGRLYRNTPYTYTCTRRAPDGRPAMCQNPAGPYVDGAAVELVLFGLGQLKLDGLREAVADRDRRAAEAARLRVQQVEALTRRARMLEDAVAEATRADARSRLLARYEDTLADLDRARAEAAQPVRPDPPRWSPGVLKQLEVFRDPRAAWAQFVPKTRKEIVRALARAVLIYPDLDGYFVVVDWEGGGRAAARVKTIRRRKVYPVPEDVLALFSGEIGAVGVHRRIVGCPGTARPGGPA